MFKPDNIENEFFTRLNFSCDPALLKRGSVLISEPFLGDPNFVRSVIVLTEYDKEEGAFGFIINKPTDLLIGDVIELNSSESFPFHYGGPVMPDNLFYMHNVPEMVQDSKPVFDSLSWGGEFEDIKSLIGEKRITADNIKFFGGYSGWSSGQLEGELEERSWIITELTVDEIMKGDPDLLWKNSLKNLGPKFSIMAEFPEKPELN